MKSFLKTWWHCLVTPINKYYEHRMCRVEYFSGKKEWKCLCKIPYCYKEILKCYTYY